MIMDAIFELIPKNQLATASPLEVLTKSHTRSVEVLSLIVRSLMFLFDNRQISDFTSLRSYDCLSA